MESVKGVCWGNSEADGAEYRGWLLGHFKPKDSPLHDPLIQIKVDHVTTGMKRDATNASLDVANRTLQLLVSGRVRTSFPATSERPGQHVELNREGDYCLWEPGVLHYWEALEDGCVITIRWPP